MVQSMKAIILAAGLSTRIGSLVPKPLIELDGSTTILDRQVNSLTKAVGLPNIMAVVGYKKELIMEEHPELTYIYNEAYARTNTSKSLLRALERVEEDAMWLNGDVVFDDRVLPPLLASADSAVLADTKKCGAEEIKYSLNRFGYIQEISKQVKDAVGEAVGINVIKKKDLNRFRKELAWVDDKDFFEKALENLTMRGRLRLRPVAVGNYFCKEIDFPEDLQEVQRWLSSR